VGLDDTLREYNEKGDRKKQNEDEAREQKRKADAADAKERDEKFESVVKPQMTRMRSKICSRRFWG
jgi:hypothetical protein